jgi:hypothetical protein
LDSARRRGKGYRISGGDIFGSISKGVNKAVKTVGDAVTGKSSNKWAKSIASTVKDAAGVVEDGYKAINKTALKQDWGGAIEMAQSAVPQSVVKEALKAAFMAGGMDESAAGVAAAGSTQAFYDVDFSKSLKGQGDAAAKGAVKGAYNEGVSGGAIRDPKGINTIALDTSKRPIVKGGSIASKIKKKVDVPKLSKKVSKVAREQASIRYDPNLQFAPVAGSGFFDTLASGVKTLASDPQVQKLALEGAKQGAKAGYSAYQKNKKKKETSGGSMRPISGEGFLDTLASGVKTLASDPQVQKLALEGAKQGAKAGYSAYQKNKKKKETSGSGFKPIGGGAVSGGRPAKGSQAAKDKMAALRAMRKK